VCAPVLSRAVRVALPQKGTNRACGSALFSPSSSPGVAAQNRRELANHGTIRWARRVFRPTTLRVADRPFAHSPFRGTALPPAVPFELDIERYLLLLNPALQFFSTELVG
jgi:hypothetical protein